MLSIPFHRAGRSSQDADESVAARGDELEFGQTDVLEASTGRGGGGRKKPRVMLGAGGRAAGGGGGSSTSAAFGAGSAAAAETGRATSSSRIGTAPAGIEVRTERPSAPAAIEEEDGDPEDLLFEQDNDMGEYYDEDYY